MPDCPLCGHAAAPVDEDRRRRYFQCPECRLIFADPASHLDAAAEKAVYDLHCNDPADAGYRRFLDRLAAPLLTRLHPGMHGLDYGCGPGPALSQMLRQAGMRMTDYDPIYAPDPAALDRQYDFVTCTEVVEHFKQPAQDWERLLATVRPGGWLGVMTQLALGPERFRRWQYRNDPTHVAFHSAETFAWIGRHHGLTVERAGDAVMLLRKRRARH
ncbi:MAG: class I SAM-dependent methyltransferase [Gammaproteobacteria bacterium]